MQAGRRPADDRVGQPPFRYTAHVLTALLVRAMDASVSVDPFSLLANYGIAGVVILLIIMGQLRTKSEVLLAVKIADDRAKEVTEARAALAALTTQITTHTLPQMASLADVLDRLSKPEAQHVPDISAQLADITARLAALDKPVGGGS